ncbi:hypothetical protein [Haloarcula nitratireducens]|uniref:hypothetical protein n=1 Tax=Haloarcula nitratireducens TaxID=2487749 RepID=UPI001F356AC1|nr:hypothetical protein [Halomicroarcula nitratireducens]
MRRDIRIERTSRTNFGCALVNSVAGGTAMSDERLFIEVYGIDPDDIPVHADEPSVPDEATAIANDIHDLFCEEYGLTDVEGVATVVNPAVHEQLVSESDSREEPVGEDEQPLYAIQCRGGLLLEWTVSRQTNASVAGPNRERPALRVLYVTRNGRQAAVREWEATRQAEVRWTPESAFASVITKSPTPVMTPTTTPSSVGHSSKSDTMLLDILPRLKTRESQVLGY